MLSRYLPLCPSARGCCWEPSHHLWLREQQLQLIMCRHSQLLILAAIWLHIASIPAMQNKRVSSLLPTATEEWTKKQLRLIWNRREIINKQEGAQQYIHANERWAAFQEQQFAFPEDPFWAMLHEISVIHSVCFPLFFYCHHSCLSRFPFSRLWVQTNTHLIFNCSNLVQFSVCPYSKVNLIQRCVFKGPFNSNYRLDEWDFNFQLRQLTSIQKRQILPSSAIQLSVLHFV